MRMRKKLKSRGYKGKLTHWTEALMKNTLIIQNACERVFNPLPLP